MKNEKLNAGLLWRGVTAQNRYDVGSGSEIGQDIGRTGGFGILSANISYRATKNVLITAGVDNIFNKNYAEFFKQNRC
jgi:iron complex outermembrane receptor protein